MRSALRAALFAAACIDVASAGCSALVGIEEGRDRPVDAGVSDHSIPDAVTGMSSHEASVGDEPAMADSTAPTPDASDGATGEGSTGQPDVVENDSTLGPDSDAGADVGTGVEASADADATAEPDVVDAGQAADSADASACGPSADETVGVFVDATVGTDALDCGTRTAPCATIGAALMRAQAVSKAKVYVAEGAYFGPITLVAGVSIEGGWSSSWQPLCTQAIQAVTITGTSTGAATIVAADLGGTASLKTLTVYSKPASSVGPAETVYGIQATGSTTTLTLTDVVVQTVAGGAGAGGDAGAQGQSSTGQCPAGTGGIGAPGAFGAAAPQGSFTATGYAWASGGTGQTGSDGQGGSSGGGGTCASQPCYCGPSTSDTCPTPDCASDGTSGCGGSGGLGGSAGGGGGSSVAVFVAGATVTGTGGLLQAGNGGAGGAGGTGGPGGVGSGGAVGAQATCNTTCDCVPSFCCIPGTPVVLPGGAAGGNGGTGGVGGTGAGGPGGWSCAYVSLDAGVTWSGTRFAVGAAGAGGPPGGAVGVAKDQCP